ncbi:hypothetical protein ACHAXS_007216 [Conticribra weissflogii]
MSVPTSSARKRCSSAGGENPDNCSSLQKQDVDFVFENNSLPASSLIAPKKCYRSRVSPDMFDNLTRPIKRSKLSNLKSVNGLIGPNSIAWKATPSPVNQIVSVTSSSTMGITTTQVLPNTTFPPKTSRVGNRTSISNQTSIPTRIFDYLLSKMNSCQTSKISQDAYDEGMNMYPRLLQVSDRDVLGCPSVVAALLFNVGQIKLQRNEDDEALSCFLMAEEVVDRDWPHNFSTAATENVAIVSSVSNFIAHLNTKASTATKSNSAANTPKNISFTLSTTERIAILHNIGYIHYRQCRYELALEQFVSVYNYSSESFGHAGDLSIAIALNCIGVVLFHMKKSKNGYVRDIFLQSLNIRRAILDSSREKVENVNVATTLNNLGRSHFDSGDYSQALCYYQQSLSMRRRLLGPHHIDVGASSFNTGQAHHKLGHLREAIEFYHEFYRLSSKRHGEMHQDVVIVFKLLGQAHHEKEESMTALGFYSKALYISRKVSGKFNREAASILNMLGNLHYESGDYDQAIRVYEEGLAVERVVLDKICVNIVVTLSNIGKAQMKKGEYSEALKKYSEAYSIQCCFTKKDVQKTETLSIIGQINSMIGKYKKAQHVFTEVVKLRKRALGDHVDVALALNYLGLVNFKQGDLDSAMENFKESLEIRKSCCSEQNGDIAVLMYNIASIYLHRGDNDMALVHYQHALSIETSHLGEFHPDVMMTLKLIGKVYERCGQYDRALEYYNKALIVSRKSLGISSSNTATNDTTKENKLVAGRLLALIAGVHLRQANTDQMRQAISEAYRIYLEIGAPVEELELDGFDLYDVATMHPECAAAA